MWSQTEIELPSKARGFHLITNEVVGRLELSSVKTGILHLFIQHTSASLTLNENASGEVRRDFERYFSRAIPDGAEYFEHTLEGPDDMPAHIKAAMLGSSLSIPISDGKLALGTWQGIYLCEHRDNAGKRLLVATVHGEAA